jgi:chaperonin GroES
MMLVSPFEWQQLQSTGDDVRKNVVPLPVREPSNVLFQLLGLMIEAGKELSSTVPMMMGQNPGQNQPATTTMAVIDQGSKVYSAIFKRMHRALHQELKKLKRLNKLFLPKESYFAVLDAKIDEDGQSEIFRQDYSDDTTDVQPYSDPNIVSVEQRMAKARQVNEMMAQGILPNPIEGARVILEAMDLPEVDKLLTPPEPQPNPEFELEKLKIQSEAQYKMGDLEIKAQLADAQVVVLESQAMLNLAKAQSESNTVQIKVYEAQVKELKERREGLSSIIEAQKHDQSGSMDGMEGAPDNGAAS